MRGPRGVGTTLAVTGRCGSSWTHRRRPAWRGPVWGRCGRTMVPAVCCSGRTNTRVGDPQAKIVSDWLRENCRGKWREEPREDPSCRWEPTWASAGPCCAGWASHVPMPRCLQTMAGGNHVHQDTSRCEHAEAMGDGHAIHGLGRHGHHGGCGSHEASAGRAAPGGRGGHGRRARVSRARHAEEHQSWEGEGRCAMGPRAGTVTPGC